MRTWLKKGIQEKNWYKPEPGEPYRPLIAMPSRVKQIQPWLSYCTEVFFTAYDPPTVLRAASALAPPVASSDPEAHPRVSVPSLTVDPVARQTVGSKPSTPLPASTPVVDQPKATTNAAQNPPNGKGSDNSPRPKNDPASQGSPLLLPTLNAVGSNSDPKGNNNHQQNGDLQPSSDPTIESDPAQALDLKKSSDSGGNLRDGADPKLHTQADNSHGSEQNVDPVLQGSDTNQINEVDPFNHFTEGQTKTINNQVIQPLSHGISIAGTTLIPGSPPITVSDTPIHFAPSALIIGPSTVPFVPEKPAPDPNPDLLTTIIAGQLITAAPSALTIPGTTLNPVSPSVNLAETLISLDTASHQLIVGTKTIPFDSASEENPIITTVNGQAITAYPDRIAIAGTVLTPGAAGVVVGGTLVSLNEAGQVVVGSKTVVALQSGGGTGLVTGGGLTLPSEVSTEDILVTTVNGHAITNSPNLTPSMRKNNISSLPASGAPADIKGHRNANGSNTTTAPQIFQGNAPSLLLESYHKVTMIASLVIAMMMAMAMGGVVDIC